MQILLTTPYFRPSIGGVETMAETLALAFAAKGHTVTVVTLTDGEEESGGAYRVVRRPGARQLWALSRAADAVLQNHVSLRLGWAAAVQRRPMVIAHHMWTAKRGPGSLLGLLKHWFSGGRRNIAVSAAIARTLPADTVVIPNPYRDDLFKVQNDACREVDLVYVGRLVDGKGVHRLIEAIALLRERGLQPSLSVIGQGSAEPSLRQLASRLELDGQVNFVGSVRDQALVDCLNRHRILIVPSIWEEPFGLVALEGMACGLVVVGTEVGGLPDAIGPGGVVVQPDSAPALAEALANLLTHADLLDRYRAAASAHLALHRGQTVAERYLDELDASRTCHG